MSQHAQPHRCHAEQSEASRIFSCYKIQILRLRPQNDIATQSLEGEDEGEGEKCLTTNVKIFPLCSMRSLRLNSVLNREELEGHEEVGIDAESPYRHQPG